MAYNPVAGDVIRYDFLWKEEQQQGREDGAKDRPCAIVLTTKPLEDGSQQVVVVPITHSPPSSHDKSSSIEIPPKLAKHLGLDDGPSWIRTDQVNIIAWEKKQLPVGVVPVDFGQWTYGRLPRALGKKVFDDVKQRSQKGTLSKVERDDP